MARLFSIQSRWGTAIEHARHYVSDNATLFLWLAGIGVFVIGTLSLVLGVQSATIAGILLFLSVVAHESAHAITSVLSGVEVKAVRCSAIGPHIVRAKSESAYVELAVAIAGPLTNLFLCLVLWQVHAPMAGWASSANFGLGVINLLPLKHSDGAKMVAALRTIGSKF